MKNDPLNKPVLWGTHTHSWTAYQEGQKAKQEDKNPYPKNSSNWYSWNGGKNSQE